ncbi:MAG: cation diffusion facilitator family transporter [Deltaproteobacteria bacterium]|jgi:cation diffusion facilitator family transporter|nr:cation diffusion facilitator family transporter [Deltaproteobacteria bacterium]
MSEPAPANHGAKSRYAVLSVVSNSCLIALKLVAGLATGSVAILSEAAHSFLDLLASFLTLIAVRFSAHPPDADHPFGHGKVENVSALFEALLIIAGGLYIVKEAVEGLVGGRELPSLSLGLAVMLFSSIVNHVVSKVLFSVGKKTGSPALVADAWHLKTDVMTSFGIFLALLVISLGKLVEPGLDLDFVDSVAALVVSFFIIKTGWTLASEAVSNLIDHSLSPAELKLIEEHIAGFAPAVKGYRRLRSRRSGPFQIVAVDLLVDASLSVGEAHGLGVKVAEAVREHYPRADVTFHLEPVPSDGSPPPAGV